MPPGGRRSQCRPLKKLLRYLALKSLQQQIQRWFDQKGDRGKALFLAVHATGNPPTFVPIAIREEGVWKIARLHFFTTYYVEYDRGWNQGGVPLAPPLPGVDPDSVATVNYGAFPDVFVPPYHYPNPVTGKPWKPA